MMGDLERSYKARLDCGLEPQTTALVIVDMQYHDAHPDHGFCLGMERVSPGSMAYYNQRLERTTVPSIRSLLTLFRSNGLKVVYLLLGSEYRDYRDLYPRYREWQLQFEQDCGIEGMLWNGSPLYQVRAELAPVPDDVVIMKKTYGAFASTDLEQRLRTMGIESLVITGVTTSACPETTAREAADRGFAAVMVDEALCDTREETHDASLRCFSAVFGDVLKDPEAVRTALSI
jgi:biuret amidohydrolase